MKTNMKTHADAHFSPPAARDIGKEEDGIMGISVEASGIGTLTDLSYVCGAFSHMQLNVKLQIKALTSEDIDKLNEMVNSFLSPSKKKELSTYGKSQDSANLSFWSFLSYGSSADKKTTTASMLSLGLTKEQITKIRNTMFDCSSSMSFVEMEITIDNTKSYFEVKGDIQLYTISGKISTDTGKAQYKMLANEGKAGSGLIKAKTKIKIIAQK